MGYFAAGRLTPTYPYSSARSVGHLFTYPHMQTDFEWKSRSQKAIARYTADGGGTARKANFSPDDPYPPTARKVTRNAHIRAEFEETWTAAGTSHFRHPSH